MKIYNQWRECLMEKGEVFALVVDLNEAVKIVELVAIGTVIGLGLYEFGKYCINEMIVPVLEERTTKKKIKKGRVWPFSQ
jgi:hypothetical protein